MTDGPVGQSKARDPHPSVQEVETALADLRRALEEDDTVEKHYHVRSAMQRLEILLERADRR